MKNLALIIAFAILSSVSVFAQPSALTKLSEKFSGKEGVVFVNLNSPASIANMVGEDKKGKEMMQGINGFKVISFDSECQEEIRKAFISEIKTIDFAKEGYNEFMTINEGGNSVRMFTKTNSGADSEFLLIASEQDGEAAIVWISGSKSIKDLQDIGNMMGNRIYSDSQAKKASKHKSKKTPKGE